MALKKGQTLELGPNVRLSTITNKHKRKAAIATEKARKKSILPGHKSIGKRKGALAGSGIGGGVGKFTRGVIRTPVNSKVGGR